MWLGKVRLLLGSASLGERVLREHQSRSQTNNVGHALRKWARFLYLRFQQERKVSHRGITVEEWKAGRV